MFVAGIPLLLAGWSAVALPHAPLNALLDRRGSSGGSAPARRRLGVGLLAVSLAPFVAAYGVAQGLVYWTVCLMLAALVVVRIGTALLRSRAPSQR